MLPIYFILLSCGTISMAEKLPYGIQLKLSGSDLQFPCCSTKNIYTSTGRYISKNVIGTRMQFFHDTAFLLLPRYRPGVPFSLAKFNLTSSNGKVLLEPFPSWTLQEEGNCESIQNAIDLFMDPFERLWILDLGIVNTLEQPIRRCSAKIWGFNASSGEILSVINLENLLGDNSRLQYILVDYSSEGMPFAYISDAGAGAIIVLNLLTSTGYRVVLPRAVSVNCGVKDILYVQLARKSTGNVVYFSYLSSPRLFSIKTSCLQSGEVSGAILDVGSKPVGTQMVLLGTDNGEGIFFRYKGQSDIYLWKSDDIFDGAKFSLVQRGGDCRLATQVVPGWGKVLWIIESNFHDYIAGTHGCLGATVALYPMVKTIG
ncbi:hypothetical protein ABEB36_009040 [Hypothenemus hampei]|uniref:Uncharacterized protein n=1 Tax=Hypothenemus hampei TaxID=57062 RepID=A0ABD1EPH1_HYPHA